MSGFLRYSNYHEKHFHISSIATFNIQEVFVHLAIKYAYLRITQLLNQQLLAYFHVEVYFM